MKLNLRSMSYSNPNNMNRRGVNNFMNPNFYGGAEVEYVDDSRSYNNDYSIDNNQNQYQIKDASDYERYKMQRTFM